MDNRICANPKYKQTLASHEQIQMTQGGGANLWEAKTGKEKDQ